MTPLCIAPIHSNRYPFLLPLPRKKRVPDPLFSPRENGSMLSMLTESVTSFVTDISISSERRSSEYMSLIARLHTYLMKSNIPGGINANMA